MYALPARCVTDSFSDLDWYKYDGYYWKYFKESYARGEYQEVKDYFKNKNNAISDISLLMGYNLSKVFSLRSENGTAITPRQIELLMKKMGFTDVIRYCSSNFTTQMVTATSDMLRQGKPVFISAFPKGLINGVTNGHSWVIDGAKYSGSEYLLHFNMGWGGKCNGYYNIDCLNPTAAEDYDYANDANAYSNPENYSQREEYTWHFRLITYNCDKNSTPVIWSF